MTKEYTCSIDIGSSVIRVITGRDHGEMGLEIVGVGMAQSRGVKSGVIINIEAVQQAIGEAVKEAELMSGLPIHEASVNVSGRHLHGDNSRGVVAITNRDRVITEDDVFRVIEGAQNLRIPVDQEIIHVLSREYTVDDQEGVRDPVGMSGVRLEADVHIVTAGITPLTNLHKSVTQSGIAVSSGIMSSLAASEAVLSEGEKDLGVVSVDIGGGVVDLSMFVDGGIYHSSVIPLGGIHVSQDLAIGLKVPLDRAEWIKKSQGVALSALVDPTEKLEIAGSYGRPGRWILKREISEIIEPRMREIFEHVDRELVRSGRKNSLSGGVVLSGGGALLEGAVELAEEVFALPVMRGRPPVMAGLGDRVSGCDFATGVGLLLYQNRVAPEGNGGDDPGREDAGDGWFHRIRQWVRENL